ncbi:uncharacterized protein Osi20 [Neodiprion pinetum]|uniref:Uncharacterized protein LOC124294843 n=1 Tax=Neodiprion lecontei TaxID=441921 RepID=A0ABM3GDG1_NEOLC|nr:uncharacterized protein LOC124182945 [Neodiprion fabricii]XP_046487310.1 uncharacterized protein LOC124221394 [Neodiprion pinetum]XP_046598316.1 uncharacterized protein LOC124294843 [Neodiprion lecontei]XP_046619688.1 uncharacterized protein LOC124304926 [Neodiprion virginianus]
MRLLTFVALVASAAASQDFLSTSLNHCINAESWSSCFKTEVLGYMDEKLGTTTEARSLDTVDEAVVARTFKYLKSFDYGIDIPFADASLKYRPSRSLADLDIEFKDNAVATSQARGLLKKKLLFPFLLLLKLKLKALMPIFVAIIGLKALKALVLSKLAILMVVGFIAVQFLKKGGMAMPMGMSMDPASVLYGAPATPSTTSSYDPANTWDGNGPYSRVWTPTSGVEAQNLAYNYYSGSGSSGAQSSYGSPSSSSSSSSSSTNY